MKLTRFFISEGRIVGRDEADTASLTSKVRAAARDALLSLRNGDPGVVALPPGITVSLGIPESPLPPNITDKAREQLGDDAPQVFSRAFQQTHARVFRLSPAGAARGRVYQVVPAPGAPDSMGDLLLYMLGGSLAAARVRAQAQRPPPDVSADVADVRSVQEQIAAAGPALVCLAPGPGDAGPEEFALAFAAVLLELSTSAPPLA